ncbi:MAG: hypothetical protein ACKVJN_13255 [Woeseiales bacterium]
MSYTRIFPLPYCAMIVAISLASLAIAQDQSVEPEPKGAQAEAMTAERLSALILSVDEDAQLNDTVWFFHVAELETAVIYDIAADRMRIVMPIGSTDGISNDELIRVMQANYDSALDARYAIANEQMWGVYIHPLSELSDDEFLTALGETANIVISYGTSYSSGLFMFGGGDSAEIQQRELIEELKKRKI